MYIYIHTHKYLGHISRKSDRETREIPSVMERRVGKKGGKKGGRGGSGIKRQQLDRAGSVQERNDDAVGS